jgi:glycosyltransferase involved in cell wall biosynthesis
MSRILFMVPHKKFFQQHGGIGGHVSHVIGILGGFASLGSCADVVVCDGAPQFSEVHRTTVARTGSFDLIGNPIWFFRFFLAVRKLRKTKKFDFAYVRYSVSSAPFFPILRLAIGSLPLVVEVNSLGSWGHPQLLWLERLALRQADHIVAISGLAADRIRETLASDADVSITIVPNGVDFSRFASCKSKAKSSETIRVGYMGILKFNYGLETLLEASRLLQETEFRFEFLVAGAGPARKELEELADGLSVEFPGTVDFDSVPEWLANCDVLVYTTSNTNSFQSPIKIFEYMASGTPIVAASTPQISTVLQDGALGLIYDAENAEALADCIAEIVVDPVSARSRAEKARYTAEKSHSWKTRASVIESIVASRSRS